ncbi:hypothetical protein Tco_0168148 [Tanacetum coccineum]
MDPFQLHMKVFPLSLSWDVRKWWINEGDGKITTWEELVKKFFGKFYPLSCASNYDKMCEDDENGQVGNEERLMNDVVSSDEEWEEHEYGDPPNIVADSSKPYLDTHHKRDGSNNAKWNENTSELGKAPHPNKVSDAGRTCKTEKFEVIKYSLGPNEEYIAI